MSHQQNGFPPSSAGRLMVREVPMVFPEALSSSIEQAIKKQADTLESINYVYVVDRHHTLLGVFSIKELMRAKAGQTARDLMVGEVHSVHPYSDQERAAYLALKHNITAVPVVEKNGRFLGVVTSDALLAVMHKEVSDDLLRMAGLRHHKLINDDVLSLPLWQSVIHRLPWLYIGLSGGLLIAFIIHFFGGVLRQHIILAAFIPLIVYMSSAVGTQLQAYIIRDIAINTMLPLRSYFFRQLSVVVAIALPSSILLYVFSFVFSGNARVALAMGVAMLVAICSSIVTGLVIPYAFIRERLDPANASGPVGTIVQDLLSVCIYLGVASWIL